MRRLAATSEATGCGVLIIAHDHVECRRQVGLPPTAIWPPKSTIQGWLWVGLATNRRRASPLPNATPYRRARRYAGRVHADITRDQLAALSSAADRHDLSVAEVLRECIAELPRVRDRLRKRSRNE